MNVVDLVTDYPKVTVGVGATLRADDFPDVRLIVIEKGLVVLRSVEVGSTRQTITCYAGAGAVVLPPYQDEVLVALSAATLWPISAAERERLLESPETAAALVDGLSETLRQKHNSIATMGRLHHVDRVRAKLLELARTHGRVGADAIRLDFPLTHDLLGEMTGSTRETVTRALDELQREGFVVRHGRTYSLRLSPDDL